MTSVLTKAQVESVFESIYATARNAEDVARGQSHSTSELDKVQFQLIADLANNQQWLSGMLKRHLEDVASTNSK